MSHFLTVPINENGIIFDQNIAQELSNAAAAPFAFTDVYVYSHGWWNTASSASAEYNIFSLGFARVLFTLAANTPTVCPRFSGNYSPLALAIHWPSMLSEDQNSVANFLEATSFFTMQQRADSVGRHAGYSLLRLLIESRKGATALRFNLIGHSFGCRVVCAALQALTDDPAMLADIGGTQFNVVLLQAATDSDSLGHGQLYGDIQSKLRALRMLVTTSARDKALGTWYPAAQRLAHLFSDGAEALGFKGPTGELAIAVDERVQVAQGTVPTVKGRFAVADLTPLHDAHAAAYGADSNWGGQHSDINLPEIYELLARFLGT